MLAQESVRFGHQGDAPRGLRGGRAAQCDQSVVEKPNGATRSPKGEEVATAIGVGLCQQPGRNIGNRSQSHFQECERFLGTPREEPRTTARRHDPTRCSWQAIPEAQGGFEGSLTQRQGIIDSSRHDQTHADGSKSAQANCIVVDRTDGGQAQLGGLVKAGGVGKEYGPLAAQDPLYEWVGDPELCRFKIPESIVETTQPPADSQRYGIRQSFAIPIAWFIPEERSEYVLRLLELLLAQ